MAPFTTLDVWHVVASVCCISVTIFLCWALYEIVRVLRQVDRFLTDIRDKVAAIEEAVESLQERFTSFAGIASMVAEGGKTLVSMMGSTKDKKKKALKKELQDLENEE